MPILSPTILIALPKGHDGRDRTSGKIGMYSATRASSFAFLIFRISSAFFVAVTEASSSSRAYQWTSFSNGLRERPSKQAKAGQQQPLGEGRGREEERGFYH
jgi:hypothetical protein